ncbi:hypothetical protein [Hyphococcus sp. DH-69]|uniref:hypothetical protein n=1 Tax=Hyphococcus formosus TaxID=3143534 RepID=UPI00398AA8FC
MRTYKINHLMRNFREALVLLVPVFETIDLSWKKESDQYDDFDEISEALFRNLVVRSISSAMNSSALMEKLVYGFVPARHNIYSYIRVRTSTNDIPHGAFLRFATHRSPFDKVVYLPVSNSNIQNNSEGIMGIEEVEFSFVNRENKNNEVQEVFEISLAL